MKKTVKPPATRRPAATFGVCLRNARRAAGFLTARSLAARLGIHENRYTRFERGAAEPNFELIVHICKLLTVTPNDLFGIATRSDRRPRDRRDATALAFAEAEQPALVRGDAADPLLAAAATQFVASRAASAAWKLAREVQRARQRHDLATSREVDTELTVLREAAAIFEDLAAAPYAAVGRIASDPALAAMNRKSRLALRKQIEVFIATVEREALSRG